MITMTGEYGLRAAVYLAQLYPTACTAAQIAEATQVPPGYLSKILQGMGRMGLVHSQRGLGGGFQLSRDPNAISVLEVLKAAGSPVQRIHECPLGLPEHIALCPVHKLVDDGMKLVEASFASAMLGTLSLSLEGIPTALGDVAATHARKLRKQGTRENPPA